MRSILYISTIGILLLGCITQKNSTADQIIISEKFQDSDSISITLEYRDFESCIDDQPAKRILMFFQNGKTTILKYDNTNSNRTNGPIQGSVISELMAFEKRARASLGCGGYGGGHGILVRLKINEEVGEFGYCKDKWDGISELLEKLELRSKN